MNNGLFKWLAIADRHFKMTLDRELKPLHLNASNYYYLLRLNERPGMSQESLISLMYLNPSNITRAIQQLVQLGYVIKANDPADRRSVHLTLTAAGQALVPKIQQLLKRLNQQVATVLGDDSTVFQQQLEQLAKMAVRLEKGQPL
ncbi:MarR family winged helix-turn-helix transcriptional regulator [Loigolactobacillus bifermentans]|jgi:DNA-binding MarR family transcriptional regulator|uniref:HTH marR-type domain-containing protein n=1 Tax=Loigolactobacillus bifermentans DSM 20003 TaxID=1423726 RepID=A0A0R1GMR4_9LACO|nr:MarR family transcriptional regulator [Loigolactobacillus bifermentans]KRK35381.1 hypothetical protein FC07_GL000108 [Loigolactobacillus bifermentans DSM 20003]QGG60369.1 MarR family transcriptional regulator [Loigolactobacillus bifermentans]